MPSISRRYDGLTRVQRVLPLLSIVLAIALLWTGIGLHLWREHEQDRDGAIENTGNLARGFGENVTRTIEGVDQLLKTLRNVYARDPANFKLAQLVPPEGVLGGLTVQVAATDTKSLLFTSNLPGGEGIDLSDRPHIRVHMNTSADELFVSVPVLGRLSKKWSLQFTRKLFDAEGQFAGVLVISLDPYAMSRFYGALEIGHGAIIVVGLDDGVVRARAPDAEKSLGLTLSPATLELVRKPPAKDRFFVSSPLDGIERLYSSRQIEGYKLAVLVGLDTAEVFAPFWRDVEYYLAAGLGLSVLIVLLGAALVQQRTRLVASQQRLSATLENISQGILMIDADGTVPVLNQRAVALLGLPQDLAYEGITFAEILDWQLLHADLLPPAPGEPDIRASARKRLFEPPSYERTRPNGVALEVRTQMLPDGGAVRTYTDITERKRTAQALEAARDAAEAASRARAKFLAIVSHEVRTPINGVIGISGLLLDSELSAEQRHYAEALRESAEDLLRIINDILDFSKLEANRMDLDVISFDFPHVVMGVIDLLHVKASEKQLSLSADIAPDMPRHLRGDPGRIRQILLNLVDNGLKFTESGGVTVSVTLLSRVGDKVRIAMRVRDTGIGIPKAALAGLFEQFNQVDSSISRRFGGTGLGLAISRRLIEQMEGSIAVKSVLGEGAEFTFDLLLEVDHSHAAMPQTAFRLNKPSGPAQAVIPARRLRILLAEDNPTNRMVAVARLETMGHRVDAVANGDEAVAAVQTVPYDMVLMDVMMPGTDGLTATRMIRDFGGPASEIPIVAITANVMRQHQQACTEAGMDGFLGKPFLTEELQAIVDSAIAGTLRGKPSVSLNGARAPMPLHPETFSAEAQPDRRIFAALVEQVGQETAEILLVALRDEGVLRLKALRTASGRGDGVALSREARALAVAADTVGVAGLADQARSLVSADTENHSDIIGRIEILLEQLPR